MKLNHITNENKNLQEKMRFFADYFSFANEFLGKLPHVPFDSALSLVDKTIFQIENNFSYCPVYAISYLSQLFTFHNNTFDQPTELLININSHLKLLKVAVDKKLWLQTNPNFIEDLKLLKSDFEKDLFENNYLCLLNRIQCDHPLKKHKKEIEYRTRILVSLFRLKGHSQESLNNYISRIISNDKYTFPFPPEFFKIKTKKEYNDSTKVFFQDRDFKTQFEGLKNLFIAEHHKDGYFFYVIDNCILEENIKNIFKVTFEKVTFVSPRHKELGLLRKSVRNHDKENFEKMYAIFFGKDKLLAYVHMGYESKDSKKDVGIQIVSEELLALNQYFEGNLVVNNLHYLVYDSFDSELWSATKSMFKVKKTRINKYEYEEFTSNPYEVLRTNNSPAKALILQSEKVFLKAFAREDVEYYWIFIENIFAPIETNSDKIRKGFSKLLLQLLDELKVDFLFKIGNMLIPFSFNYKEENLDENELYLIHEEIFTKRNYDFDIYQYKGKVKSNFLKDILEYHNTFKSSENSQLWKEHFSFLLLDLYAYRNSLVHSGQINRYCQIKLENVLPKLISRARWLIIKSCNKNENLSYKDLIEKIIK